MRRETVIGAVVATLAAGAAGAGLAQEAFEPEAFEPSAFEPAASGPGAFVAAPRGSEAIAPLAPRPLAGGSFTLRGGVAVRPNYPGADGYRLGPDLGFSFGSLQAGRLAVGDPSPDEEPMGLGLRGSFRYVGPRDASGFDALRGLDDVDPALELGLGLAYRQEAYRVFGDLRYGVTGHHALVGEVGADVLLRPTDRLTLNVGPRVFFGADDYARSYFGVSDAEALRSGLEAFDADGGALSAGVELGARYRLNDDWGVEGAVTYDRLIGDAGDSPITDAGSADQYGVRLGLTRRITFGF